MHIQLNIYIVVYQMSPTCFGAHRAIFRENSSSHAQNYVLVAILLHWLQCIRYIKCGFYKVTYNY